LQALDWLSISFNQFESVPESILELQALSTLRLTGNQKLKQIPDIGRLKNLTELRVDKTKLETLPVNVGELEKLTTLDLEHTPLHTIPNAKVLALLVKCEVKRLPIAPVPVWALIPFTYSYPEKEYDVDLLFYRVPALKVARIKASEVQLIRARHIVFTLCQWNRLYTDLALPYMIMAAIAERTIAFEAKRSKLPYVPGRVTQYVGNLFAGTQRESIANYRPIQGAEDYKLLV
jgi:hypothetical protein